MEQIKENWKVNYVWNEIRNYSKGSEETWIQVIQILHLEEMMFTKDFHYGLMDTKNTRVTLVKLVLPSNPIAFSSPLHGIGSKKARYNHQTADEVKRFACCLLWVGCTTVSTFRPILSRVLKSIIALVRWKPRTYRRIRASWDNVTRGLVFLTYVIAGNYFWWRLSMLH